MQYNPLYKVKQKTLSDKTLSSSLFTNSQLFRLACRGPNALGATLHIYFLIWLQIFFSVFISFYFELYRE